MYSSDYTLLICLCMIGRFYFVRQVSSFKFPVERVNEKGENEWVLDTGRDTSCVPLKKCPTFAWMLDYENIQNEVIQIEPRKVFKLLRGKRCSMKKDDSSMELTLDTLVACPNVVDLEEDYDEYGANDGDVILDTRGGYEDCNQPYPNRLGGGLETKRMSQDFDCSLDLTHGDVDNLLSTLKTQRFSGQQKYYRRLKRLEIRHILHIEAHGFCCWEIFQKSNLRGDIHYVEPGNSVYPVHQPRSIKRVCC